MKSKALVPLSVTLLLLAVALTPATAHEYDRNDSDNPLRVVAYIIHPVGVALEYAITRPIHKLAHKSTKWAYALGHSLTDGRQDVRPGQAVMPPEDLAPPPAPIEEKADETAQLQAIQQALETSEAPPAEEETVKVEVTEEGIRFTIVGDAVLFRSGSADLTPEGRVVVSKLALLIKEKYPENEMLVEGHTDNQPIMRSGWESNWELGAARALTLVRFMIDQEGFQPAKIAAMTHGEFKNAKPNDSDENMTENRRAVITVKTNT